MPPAIQSDLLTAGIDAALFLMAGIVIGYVLFGWLLYTLVLHPRG